MPAAPTSTVRTWPVFLDRPPEVVRVGIGRHGVHRLVEHWRLPDLWSLHLYRYNAELTVDHSPLPISPGDVSVVPPGMGKPLARNAAAFPRWASATKRVCARGQ